MHKLPMLITAALASVVVSSAALAGSADACGVADQAVVASSAVKPVPVHVVRPVNLPWSFDRATVDLSFTVDEYGVPHDVHTVNRVPSDVATSLITAVTQWRFRPMTENGRPVKTRVVLPLTLVSEA